VYAAETLRNITQKVEHQHRKNMWRETKNVRAAIYARVSTVDQDCAIQLESLRKHVRRCDWAAAREYVEKLSGKEGNRRPELEHLLDDVRQGDIDVVLVWKLDRFGRSTLDTLNNVDTLRQYRVRFWCPTMNIDTDNSSPIGKFTLQVFAAVAELERAFILERTRAGYDAYRDDYAGGKIGRTRHSRSGKDLPVGRPRRIFNRERALDMRRAGQSVRQIASALGVGVGTIHRLISRVP
jgi:putative DNA-invertase from lambdoid prophage Rac